MEVLSRGAQGLHQRLPGQQGSLEKSPGVLFDRKLNAHALSFTHM